MKQHGWAFIPIAFTATIVLPACNKGTDTTAPTTAITSPANNTSLAGTTPIQISAEDDTKVSKVQLYARGQGSKQKGVLVGSAVSKPFVVSVNTASLPNNTKLELVAYATDTTGNTGTSDPVRFGISNNGIPVMDSFAAFTMPIKPVGVLSFSNNNTGLVAGFDWRNIQPPSNLTANNAINNRQALLAQSINPLMVTDRNYAVEWAWNPFGNAVGYGIYLASSDLAGPYELQRNQLPKAANVGLQKFSKNITGVSAGSQVFGLVTALIPSESGLSNADATIFLPPQDSVSPAEGVVISDGKPTLSWTQTTGVIGYLWFILDKNPWDSTANVLCTNSPKSTDQLSVIYPSAPGGAVQCDPLKSGGTYYWWVAGVSFDAALKPDALSYSDPKMFTVP